LINYEPLKPTLLLSLHPENTAAIVAGDKVIEYRRRFFTNPFQAFVYTTGRSGGIDLFITCDRPIQGNAQMLAAIGAEIQHDDYHEIKVYFATKDSGLIIPITSWARLPMLSLATLREKFSNFFTPQGYTFLDRPERVAQRDFLLNQPVLEHGTIDWEAKYQVINKMSN